MAIKKISVVEDFHEFPSGRFKINGSGSGEEFRDDFLVPALESGDELLIKLDGAPGYPSSFLEETFGGLIRHGYTIDELRKKIKFNVTDSIFTVYEMLAWEYMEKAERILNTSKK